MDQPVIRGALHAGRAGAAGNRLHLLATARQALSVQRTGRLTMDGLVERAELGKGTVFRRSGTRAGIFQALLDYEPLGVQRVQGDDRARQVQAR